MTDDRSNHGSAAGMRCERALELMPRYLDGELAEGQAAMLRQHLMACPGCRGVASEGRALERWFVPAAAPEVPAGFSSRVMSALRDAEGRAVERPEAPIASGAITAGPVAERAPHGASLRDFVLAVTALAAAALFALSVALGMRDRPSGESLLAEPVGEVLEQLEALNAAEAGAGLR